jgi:hypothetical protein
MTDYKTIGAELGALLEEKQAAYGDVFSATPAIIGLLFPNGIPVAGYRDVLTIVRILDKIGRICTAAGKGDPMGEDPWRDIAGYAMLMLGKREEKKAEPYQTPEDGSRWVVWYTDKTGTWPVGTYRTAAEARAAGEKHEAWYPADDVTYERLP